MIGFGPAAEVAVGFGARRAVEAAEFVEGGDERGAGGRRGLADEFFEDPECFVGLVASGEGAGHAEHGGVLELRGDAAAAVGEGVEFGEGVFGFAGGEGETGAEVAERGGEGWGWRGERGDESGGFGWAVGGELEFSGPETGACGGIGGGICEERGEGGDGEVRVACGGGDGGAGEGGFGGPWEALGGKSGEGG